MYDDIYLVHAQYTPSNVFLKNLPEKRTNQFLSYTGISKCYLNLKGKKMLKSITFVGLFVLVIAVSNQSLRRGSNFILFCIFINVIYKLSPS